MPVAKLTNKEQDKVSFYFQRGYKKLALDDIEDIINYSLLSEESNDGNEGLAGTD